MRARSLVCADAGLKGLNICFDAFHAIDEAGDGVGHRVEELGGVCSGKCMGLEVLRLHGPAASEEPVGADGKGAGELRDELDAGRRNALQVTPDGLRVRFGEVADMSVRARADRGDDPLVELGSLGRGW
jgi:hypothetical protein